MHLLSLINQLLDLARIEAGKMDLAIERHDLVEIVRYCTTMLEDGAAKRRIALELDLPSAAVIATDLLAARQIVLNILSNAIKFTEPGGRARIAVAVDRDLAQLTIQDTGIGIAEEDLPRLMEPFAQAGDILSRRVTGSGLGLAIARALVELQGGTIAIDSTLGVGTTVRVALPLAPIENSQAAD